MTEKERKKIEKRLQTEAYMCCAFVMFVFIQLVAISIAIEGRGYENVIAWMLVSYVSLSISVLAWWRLGKMRD